MIHSAQLLDCSLQRTLRRQQREGPSLRSGDRRALVQEREIVAPCPERGQVAVVPVEGQPALTGCVDDAGGVPVLCIDQQAQGRDDDLTVGRLRGGGSDGDRGGVTTWGGGGAVEDPGQGGHAPQRVLQGQRVPAAPPPAAAIRPQPPFQVAHRLAERLFY